VLKPVLNFSLESETFVSDAGNHPVPFSIFEKSDDHQVTASIMPNLNTSTVWVVLLVDFTLVPVGA
jgi:hypothetical protein